jgi:hypothetical protein
MNFSPGLVFKSSINRTDKFAGIARNRGAMKSDKHSPKTGQNVVQSQRERTAHLGVKTRWLDEENGSQHGVKSIGQLVNFESPAFKRATPKQSFDVFERLKMKP